MTPAIRPNWRSSGVATEEAMVSGLAPGKLARTKMVGKSTSRQSRHWQKIKTNAACEQNGDAQQRSGDRPSYERRRDMHRWFFQPAC